MNEVASLELNRSLYEVSGWRGTMAMYDPWGQVTTLISHGGDTPAYSLGYLIRKLPKKVEDVDFTYWLTLSPIDSEAWLADYECQDMDKFGQIADTPENATAKLCIALFKQGILTKEI